MSYRLAPCLFLKPPPHMSQVLGALLIFTLIPTLGALPLTGWIVHLLTHKDLKTLGTGNISVSAAFYHGGTLAGICAVLTEALKGIFAVLLARHFFPGNAYGADIWPIFSLIFLVMGRYWGSQGAGTTNIAWGFFTYDPLVAALTFGISFISFTLLRMKNQGKLFVLVLMPVLTALAHPTQGGRILAVACLSGLVFWIYSKIPDDLELPPMKSAGESRRMFRFFQGDRALKSLATVLTPDKVGPKAATLSQLNAWGYPVAPGYILPAGDDPSALIKAVAPSQKEPVIVRSSAVGEDTLTSSAAGQYVSVTQVESPAALDQAITVCLNAYNSRSAVRYRQSRNLPEGKMSVLVQPHIFGKFSGVAFSRNPLAHGSSDHSESNAVIVEALPGDASAVVSGKITPARYQVTVSEAISESWQLPAELELSITGDSLDQKGTAPTDLIQQVAYLTRHIENRFHGIPQDVEWTFDGNQLWVLQSRPISTLMPIWTRKIAAEVIPGVIRPLTWSINRPLTCGVWGDLFTSVLGDRAQGLDFTQTATLHYARAYFNATLLGDLFTRMGLPAESLEFLTRGASFSRPPLATTLRNAPGLWRLLRQEMSLPRSFAQDQENIFRPAQTQFENAPLTDLSQPEIIERIESVLTHLEKATYYNILAPLSLALRQAIFKVDLATLNNANSPEVMALEELKTMAEQLRSHLPELGLSSPINPGDRTPPTTAASLFAALAEHPEGQHIFEQLDRFLDKYGYLSEVATDIAIPTWRESPQPVRELLTQYLLNPTQPKASPQQSNATNWKTRQIQTRLDLKGQVAETYNRLLAHLRACFVELENRWLTTGLLKQQGDIFFLTREDVNRQVSSPLPAEKIYRKVDTAKAYWRNIGEHRAPYLVYGFPAATDFPRSPQTTQPVLSAAPNNSGTLQGIGASTGQTEGTIRVLTSLTTEDTADIDSHTILVVPYTDAGWSPLLARIGGLIAEVGGQLSHGAIVAREYGIPAIMDVTDATHRLTTGQRVRINGRQGTIEILES
ncbi:MAG: glycerol-3-phosphate acyltransferase [Cyanobacteria bacterium J06598_3]